MKAALFSCLMLLAAPLCAQEREATAESDGAVLRALDMMTGELRDLDISVGETATFRRLEISLSDCRYPPDHPLRDAFAFLSIRDTTEKEPRFSGWMIASSPALSSFDHSRYDVWVLRCRIPEAAPSDGG